MGKILYSLPLFGILSSVSAFADSIGVHESLSGMAGTMTGDWLMILWGVSFLAIASVVISWILEPKTKWSVSRRALEILVERFQKGEISLAEYKRIKQDLL